MIFAAGLGTRLKPYTETMPKALVPVAGTPMIEILIKHLILNGIRDIIVNVHHFANQVVGFLNTNNGFGANITISNESDFLLDTGGGLKKAAWFFDDGKPFLVHNADVLSNINLNEMLSFHNQKKALATLFIQERTTSRYLIFDEEKRLAGWKNTKTNEVILSRENPTSPKDFAFNGIHIIDSEIFTLMTEQGKFSIIETYPRLASKFQIVGFEPKHAAWMDIGKLENLPEANILAKQIY